MGGSGSTARPATSEGNLHWDELSWLRSRQSCACPFPSVVPPLTLLLCCCYKPPSQLLSGNHHRISVTSPLETSPPFLSGLWAVLTVVRRLFLGFLCFPWHGRGCCAAGEELLIHRSCSNNPVPSSSPLLPKAPLSSPRTAWAPAFVSLPLKVVAAAEARSWGVFSPARVHLQVLQSPSRQLRADTERRLPSAWASWAPGQRMDTSTARSRRYCRRNRIDIFWRTHLSKSSWE